MIYRWMDLPQQPQLSFVERCFVSTRRRHRVLGHIILIAKDIWRVVAIVSVVIIGIGIATGVVFIAYYLVDWLLTLLFNRYHINYDVSVAIMVGTFCLCIILSFIKTSIISAVKNNNQYINESIARKLKPSSNE